MAVTPRKYECQARHFFQSQAQPDLQPWGQAPWLRTEQFR